MRTERQAFELLLPPAHEVGYGFLVKPGLGPASFFFQRPVEREALKRMACRMVEHPAPSLGAHPASEVGGQEISEVIVVGIPVLK